MEAEDKDIIESTNQEIERIIKNNLHINEIDRVLSNLKRLNDIKKKTLENGVANTENHKESILIGCKGFSWNNWACFDHKKMFLNVASILKKIIPGGADKSYGVHVAEMAGLPQAIIQRAKEILHQQSNGEATHVPEVNLDIKPQIDLFSAKEEALKNELIEIDVNKMTPLDALSKLDELKKKHGL